MSREIKFRAWDKDQNKLINTHDLYISGQADEALMCNLDNHNLVAMQYTGLKDKNGKEIYEGDILANAYHYPIGHHVKYGDVFGAVQWQECAFWVGTNDDKPLMGDGKEFEVIGNIYENPELLK